jgi:hypothetical protein
MPYCLSAFAARKSARSMEVKQVTMNKEAKLES